MSKGAVVTTTAAAREDWLDFARVSNVCGNQETRALLSRGLEMVSLHD
jgi:hypothetical protein